MKINLILAYRNLADYIGSHSSQDAWNKTMIELFWTTLTQYAPFPLDYMKPVCSMDREQAQRQLELLDAIDWNEYKGIFEEISSKLPKEDEDM